MKIIWHNQIISDFFRKLESLMVSKCDNLTNIVPHNMLGKGKIEVNDDSTIVFAKLRYLKLKNLPQLMGFYYDSESDVLFNEKVC